MDMTPASLQDTPTTMQPHTGPFDTIETRVWLQEHDWLYGILNSERNAAPSFRFPDLISACISLVFGKTDAAQRIFDYLSTELVFRPRDTPRRREAMWRAQYEMLLALQRSAANRHPHPKFQLDQLTTACVALIRETDASGDSVLQQARLNMACRAASRKPPPSICPSDPDPRVD